MRSMGRKAGLNDKQKRVADLYLQTNDYRKSYQTVYGNTNDEYSYQRGWDLINSNPYVKEYVAEQKAAMNKSMIMETEEILQIYTSIIRNDETLTKDKLKALQDMAKISGLFIDKVENTTTIEVKLPDFMLNREEEKKQLTDYVEVEYETE